jgi:hypothetical protein
VKTLQLSAAAAGLAGLAAAAALDAADAKPLEIQRNFAGSVQLDYMAVPTEDVGREQSLDGATVELSMKLAMDFGENISSNVKVCVACHGLEVGMAFFDLRVADQLNFRVGRFTPAFGEFPLRHDPANHRTSDKPLPYDMGRMLRINEFNMSILPAPWVDNGLEINGVQFFGDAAQLDYAAYAVGGPRAQSDAIDFDYKQSRSRDLFYVDNNSRPAVGGRLALTFLGRDVAFHLGGSGMYGTYDPENELDFWILGAEMFFRVGKTTLRAEALARRTRMSLGDMPSDRFRYGPGADGTYDPYFLKEGFYTELEVPLGRLDIVLRWDGLRRRGNVPELSTMRSDSALLRYTVALSYAIKGALRLKLSGERYDFSDYLDESVVHLGVAGPF